MSRTQYSLRVDEDTKDEWDQAVEDNAEYSSLRHLITISVTRELSDNYVRRDELKEILGEIDANNTNTPGIPDSNDGEWLGNITSQLDSIEQKLDVSHTITEDEEDLSGIAATIYRLTPIVDDDSLEKWLEARPKGNREWSVSTFEKWGVLFDLEVGFDEWDNWRIQKAATKMEMEAPDVYSIKDSEGMIRYWRQGETSPDYPEDPRVNLENRGDDDE
ncbi:hypothetical protein ACFQE1_02025 [Halobium palmae]|uniref:Uncharacterized protein n=1 Tax=Halobium palmae TaxID=1776492 RepID=A0ABD5RUX9_9EURY